MPRQTTEDFVRKALRKQKPDDATVEAVARKIDKALAFLKRPERVANTSLGEKK